MNQVQHINMGVPDEEESTPQEVNNDTEDKDEVPQNDDVDDGERWDCQTDNYFTRQTQGKKWGFWEAW